MTWTVVLVSALGCYLLKYAGLAAPAGVLDHPVVRRAVELVPAAMLAALVVVQAVADGRGLVLDSRLVGLAAATVALLLRAPFLVVLLVAGAAAALAQYLGVG